MMMSESMTYWDRVDSPLGPLYLARSSHGLCRAAFGMSIPAFTQAAAMGQWRHDPAALTDAAVQIREYFTRERQDFDIPLDLSTQTPFQRLVLGAVRTIPAGTVWTYGQLARHIGRPRAFRAVGAANGSNPFPLIVPCHRLIGSDGRLHGYDSGEGLATKRWLLEFEGALTPGS